MVNHPNRKKTYPDHTLENAARDAGARVIVLWEMHGPEGTAVDWMVGYQIGSAPVIVQTYTNGDGWNAFTPGSSDDIEKTIADVLNRCGRFPSADAGRSIVFCEACQAYRAIEHACD